ncbi:MAG: hypothetical protein BMS9Abin17_0410 [Acidimicrobiia bacterium]|nr:MAG: hypothetical protein BMS9Abin17_0410 [Acidimicrobiia bacterium]
MKRWFGLFAVFLVGCSQAALPVGEYVQAMEATADVYVADSQELSVQYQDQVIREITEMAQSAPPDADSLAVGIARSATTDYLDVLAKQMLRFVDDMEALTPPPDIGEEHDEFVAAVRSVYSTMPQTVSDVTQANSLDEIRLALTASGFADGQIRWTAACTALESSVRSLGSGLDIGCVRPQVVP